MVPYHWAKIAGTAIQVSAQLGAAVVSKSRTDMYMKEVNEKMFKPRGLKVSITSDSRYAAAFRPFDGRNDANEYMGEGIVGVERL